MWGWLPGRLILSGPCSWVRAGRGAAARGKQGGWLVLWFPACVVGAGVVGCLVFGVEDTPAAAWFGWWWVSLCVLVCVWGWHAVGVLG